MQKSSMVLIYGGIGLTIFGVAYDSGVLGPTDGHDHSIVFSATGTSSSLGATFAVVNNITGDAVAVPLPSRKPSQQQT